MQPTKRWWTASAVLVDDQLSPELVHLYLRADHGGVELCGREGTQKLPLLECLRGLPALQAWRGQALPYPGGVQHQAATSPAGSTPHQNLQSLGTHMAKHRRLGTRNGLSQGIKKDLLPQRPSDVMRTSSQRSSRSRVQNRLFILSP